MIAAKNFDPVLGIDIHITIIPPGIPFPMPTPFIGMVFDVFAWLPFIGTSVYVNGIPSAQAGTEGRPIPFHFPIGGVFAPKPANEAEIFMGSATVSADGAPQSRLGMPVLSCWTVGMPAPFRKFAKKKKKGFGMYMPTSVVLSIPMGSPVLVGGPPTIDLMTMAMHGLSFGAGKLFNRFIKNSSVYKKICKKVHDAASVVTKRLPANMRNRVHRKICDKIGHPVDVGSGKVFTERTDFSLNGPIPLIWQRVWYSTSDHAGELGHGWHHSYELSLNLTVDTFGIRLRLADGRSAFFYRLQDGEEAYLTQEKLNLRREGHRYVLTDSDYLSYHFDTMVVRENGDAPLLKIERAGASIVFGYDQQVHLVEIIDSGNRKLAVRTDDAGRIKSINAPHPGRQGAGRFFPLVTYDYDAAGDLVKSSDELGHSFTYEYQGHLLVRETNRNGLSFYFEYDGSGNAAWCTRTWGDGGLHSNTLRYDKENGVTTVQNSLGNVTTYFWNEDGLVYKTIDAHGEEAFRQYDLACNLLRTTDELGHSTNFGYDDLGNLTIVKYPDQTSLKMHYDGHLLIMAEDQNGGGWSWSYNEDRQLVERINCEAETTTYAYQGKRLVAITDNAGNTSRLTYDEASNLSSLTGPDGLTEKWEYDLLGRVTASESPLGQREVRHLNLRGELLKANRMDGNVQTFSYDPEGNPTKIKDRQRDIRMEFKGMNRLAARVENGQRVEFKFDTEENLIGIINEHGYAYKFERNALGEIASESRFDGLTRSYLRDPAGQVTSMLRPGPGDGELRRTDYTLDAVGNTTSVTYFDGSQEHFAYRADGKLVGAQSGTATLRFVRDQLGRVKEEYRDGYQISSSYDQLGARDKVSSSLGASLRMKRNQLGGLTSLEARQGKDKTWKAALERDAFGMEVERNLPGGLRSHWKRDQLGRPTSHTISVGDDEIARRSYDWGLNNRLKSLSIAGEGRFKFEHDTVGNLASVLKPDGTADYRLPDAVGNLFRKKDRSDREYGASGQLLRSGAWHYNYDSDGNLVEKKSVSSGDRWKYEWNGAGRLQTVQRPDGNSVSFTYDPLGRRLSKTFLGNTTHWVWDGNNPLHEWVDRSQHLPPQPKVSLLASVSSSGPEATIVEAQNTVNAVQGDLHTYVFEPGSFSPMAKLTPYNQFSVISDYLGTPLLMFDNKGEKKYEQQLDIYGGVAAAKGWREDMQFRYPGQYEDLETGLRYNRFRYYDAEEGVYLSQDPIGLAGGNPTLYGYVHDVNAAVDFFGLDSILTIFADSPPGDPIGHAFIGITENGATEYIGQWPNGGFTGDQLKEVATTGLPGTLDYNDTSHLGASSTVSRSYDLTDQQTTDLRKYVKEYDASNRQMAKGYNLRTRQCASFAYGASQAAGVKELKVGWFTWVTPKSLARKIRKLNAKSTCAK